MSQRLKALPLLAAGFVLSAPGAQAAILCEGNFQIVNGAAISTPYCQDEQLAAFERKQGVKISGEAVRRNSAVKQQVCVDAPYASGPACADNLGD